MVLRSIKEGFLLRRICITYCIYSTVFLNIDGCIYYYLSADVIYAWDNKDHEKW